MSCGAPRFTEDEYGFIRKVVKCSECEKLRQKKKQCLRCDKEFIPTCRIKFICPSCFGVLSRMHFAD